jgi:hypothetical protein
MSCGFAVIGALIDFAIRESSSLRETSDRPEDTFNLLAKLSRLKGGGSDELPQATQSFTLGFSGSSDCGVVQAGHYADHCKIG